MIYVIKYNQFIKGDLKVFEKWLEKKILCWVSIHQRPILALVYPWYTEHNRKNYKINSFKHTRTWSGHRSISFRESMPPPRESVTHWPINWQSAINSFFLSRTIFSSRFFLCVDGQRAMSQQHKQTSLTWLLLIPLETHRWRKRCC